MEREIIDTNNAPQLLKTKGIPLNQAIKVGSLVYTSGQVGFDHRANKIVEGGVRAQTRQSLENLKNILEAAGSSLDKVAKVTVFLTDMKDFEEMNEIYREYFPRNPPARSCVAVSALAWGLVVEIEAVAIT